MKQVGTFNNIPVYESPLVPDGMLYLINEDTMEYGYPKRRDGKPDMRYTVNKNMRDYGVPEIWMKNL